MTSTITAKAMARRLRADLADAHIAVSHGQALELVAHQLGHRDWNTCAAALPAAALPEPPVTIPILRTFPGDQARGFYLDYLGFTLDWEHRFEDGLPLYQQVSLGACVLHLSEHHGDATPGSAVRISIADLTGLRRRLLATDYPLRPGLSTQPWGRDMTIPDPFGNQLTFHEPAEPGSGPG